MKKILVLALLVGAVSMIAAGSAMATIASSLHDFTGTSWGSSEICKPCHTPHNADTTVTGAPLWNHQVTTASFSTYIQTGTLNAGAIGQPTGVSLLCLSCHDGTVALDNYGGVTTGTSFISGTAALGTNLSNDHPISFVYDAALATADNELRDPGAMTTTQLPLFGTLSNEMQCATCHDVHNTVSAGNLSLLIMSNTGSALCLNCHIK